MKTETELVPRWLWFPPLLLIIVFTVKLGWPQHYDQWIEGEQGLIELATPVVVFWGFFVGLGVVRWASGIPVSLVRVRALLVTLGCFYFGGEELS